MKGKRMLWVEDDYFRLRGLTRPLKKKGLEIVFAKDEKEATGLLDKKERFDIFLIDIIIPEGIDDRKVASVEVRENVGVDLIRRIRQNYNLSIPILVLTVVEDPIILQEIRNLGVSTIIPKGNFHPSELENEVALVLGLKSDNCNTW